MTRLIDTSKLYDLFPISEEERETWVVIYLGEPGPFYFCNMFQTARGDFRHAWSYDVEDAFPYPSHEAAVNDKNLAGFWKHGCIVVDRIA